MNRIRNIDNKYQVLITPTHRFDTSVELLLGNWTDEHLRGYKVIETASREDALDMALTYPDIGWDKLIIYHKDIYQKLHSIIKEHLVSNKFIIEYEPHLMTPKELKNVMFDRVNNGGNRFSLKYQLNDIIGFHIINPWSVNLKEIANILKRDQRLQIIRINDNNKIQTLIGKTDVGTTYEIVLWPTIINHWAKWHAKTGNISPVASQESLENIINTQKILDNGYIVR